MKRSRTLLVGLVLLATAGLFAQTVEKTFVRSFNITGAQDIKLQLEGAVDIQTWDQPSARVQMTVGLDSNSESMLRSLAQAGRYNLRGQLADGAYTINVPGLSRAVLVNCQSLNETVSYVVYVPDNVRVIIDNTASAANF